MICGSVWLSVVVVTGDSWSLMHYISAALGFVVLKVITRCAWLSVVALDSV